MNNPNNPFVPKGSLLELQGRRRSQLKIAVFCVVAVGAVSLSAMLIQGCERKKPAEDLSNMSESIAAMTNTPFAVDTNFVPAVSNTVAQSTFTTDSNAAPYMPPTNQDTTPVPPAAGESEYKIVKGDTLDKIAKAHGVSPKALQAANPKLDPKRLKIGDKVIIPAPTPKSSTSTSTSSTTSTGGNVYVVKKGDTLGKIAKEHGTSARAIKAVNSLATDRINVGQKLTLPDKSVTPVPVPTPTTVAPPSVPTPDPFAAPPAAPSTPTPVK